MRVLFINFNLGSTAGINNGIAILSAVLKAKGHRVGLLFLCEELGYNFDLSRMQGDVEDFKPDIIGISLMEPQSKYMEEFCKDARRYYKGFIVCGGPYPTMAPDDVLSVKDVDAVCVGEGEGALVDLAEALERGEDYRHIRNIWSRSAEGTIVKNRLRPFVDLATLPPEDKELFDIETIVRVKNYQLEMMLGRGCIYQCAYCINKSYITRYQDLCERPVGLRDYVRVKDVDTVIQEIKGTTRRHPTIRKLAFIDDNFLMYEGFLEDFCLHYKEEVRVPFMCNVNPMSFTQKKGALLKEAGCDDIRFGVESGSARIKRDIMKRHITNRSVVEAFKAARDLGLMTSSFNMIGLPGETKDEVFETIRLNAAILPDTVKVMTFYPFKNTPLYDRCEELGLIDYEKKHGLDNYDTVTCLKFPPAHRLFLKKIQIVFNVYLNLFLGGETASEYAPHAREIEEMDEERWGSYDFDSVDRALSEKLRRRGVVHYSKFMNRSLAVKFPSKHV